MTTQQENYINSGLEAYRRGLEEKDEHQIEGDVQAALAEAEEKEWERIGDMISTGRIDWSDEECEAHMKKFLEEAEGELWSRFKAECDEENETLLEKYRQELEMELAAVTE